MPLDGAEQAGHDQADGIRPRTILTHPARIEHGYEKGKRARLVSARCAAGKDGMMEALTPASADGLPPLGELVADVPFWRYPSGAAAGEGVAHLRVWTMATVPRGHLAAVTETGAAASVTETAGRIWAELARRYGPSLMLLEHQPAPGDREGAETLDVVRIAADGSARWTRVWPTPEDNPRHAGLELWMAAHGHQIVSKPASWSDRCEDQEG